MITVLSSPIQHPTNSYNTKGQLSKETIPALGDKRYTYDIYGRQTSVSIPSPTGSGVVTHSTDYSGLTTTTHSDRDGKSHLRKITRNPLGKTTTVIDNDNTKIEYTYDAKVIGALSKVESSGSDTISPMTIAYALSMRKSPSMVKHTTQEHPTIMIAPSFLVSPIQIGIK